MQVNSLIDTSLYSKFTVLSIGLLLLLFIFIFVRNYRNQIELSIVKETIFPIYLLFIFISGFSIFNAINVSEAYYDLMKNILFFIFLVFSSVLLINTNKILKPISKIIAVFTIVMTAVGLVQFFSTALQHDYSIYTAYEITGVFAHKNLFAQMLFLVLPFNIFGIYSLSKPWKALSLTNYVLALFLIVALMARSVWVAGVFALLATVFFLIMIDRNIVLAQINKNLLKPVLITFLIIIVSVTVINTINGFQIKGKTTTDEQVYEEMFGEKSTIKTHVSEIPQVESGNAFNRLVIWNKTLRMFGDYPFLGVGGGNWKIQIPNFGVDKEIIMPEKKRLQRPHNDFLWVLSENGLFGLIAWIGIFLISVFYLLRIIKVTKTNEERLFYSLMLFALIGYSVFSFFSFPRERIAHNTYIHFILAIIIAKYYQLFGVISKQTFSVKKIQLINLSLVLLLLAASFIGIKRIKGEIHTKRAISMLDIKKPGLVIREIDKAYSWFYSIDPSSTPLMWYKGLAMFHLGKTDMAIHSFRLAVKNNSFHSNVYNSLGICYAKKGDFKEAKAYFIKSTHLKPFSNEANISLAKIYLMENNEDRALQELYKADSDNKSITKTYRKFIVKDLKRRIDSLKNTFAEKDIKLAIAFFTQSEDDVFNNYRVSYKNNLPYEKQILHFVYWGLGNYKGMIKPADRKAIIKRANEL